jgi:hypothetical protein
MSAGLLHGSAEWFAMAGALMVDAATRARLPPDCNVSLVERYTDGVAGSDGLVQGLRFEIVDGMPSLRIGVGPEETADIVVEVTAAASRELNALYADDPRYAAAADRLRREGQMRIHGDLARLGDWFPAVHDPIVEHTRNQGD